MEMLNAVAANALSDGAAGMYVFNYGCHRQRSSDGDTPGAYTSAEYEGLCELHDAVVLAGRDKLFFVTLDTGWIPYGDFGRQLPRMIGSAGRGSNESQACTVRIDDDIDGARRDNRFKGAELRVLLKDADHCAARIFCLINGRRFEFSDFEKLDESIPEENMQGSFEADFRVLRDPPVRQGDNRICFLLEGIEAPEPWPEWLRCEVAVRYARAAPSAL